MARIGIVLGSIREGRLGQQIAEWVACQSVGRSCEYDLVDLKEYPLPLFNSEQIPAQSKKRYSDAMVQKWSDKIDEFDGYIFVSPEYNRNVPGPFKNAFDSLGEEWMGKPVAVVAYGFSSGGTDAITGWRMSTTGSLKMRFVENPTAIVIPENVRDGEFIPTDEVADNLLETLAGVEELLT